ncbi:MAG: hypothetical protein OJF52_003845 [Nitrospira sp.]|nr:MAG: hypothetical protein OJF52_003845 [Nitrospira sp.]
MIIATLSGTCNITLASPTVPEHRRSALLQSIEDDESSVKKLDGSAIAVPPVPFTEFMQSRAAAAPTHGPHVAAAFRQSAPPAV